jgi:hypothetical protein
MTMRSMKVTSAPNPPPNPVTLNGTAISGGLTTVTVTRNSSASSVSGTYNPPNSANVEVPTSVWNQLDTRCDTPPFTVTITHNASNQVTAINFQQASARVAALDDAEGVQSERA